MFHSLIDFPQKKKNNKPTQTSYAGMSDYLHKTALSY